MKNLFKVAVEILLAIAGLVALVALGWHAAVEYYKLGDRIEHVYTTSRLNETALENETLKAKLSDKTKDVAALSAALAEARRTPTDEDWAKTNQCLLETYATLIRSASKLTSLSRGVLCNSQLQSGYELLEGAGLSTLQTFINDGKIDTQKAALGMNALDRAMDGIKEWNQSAQSTSEELWRFRETSISYYKGSKLFREDRVGDRSFLVLTRVPGRGIDLGTGEIESLPGSTTAPSN